MNTKPVAAAVMALSLAAGGSAWAQGQSQGYGYDRGARDNNNRGTYNNHRSDNDARYHDRGRGRADNHYGRQEWHKGGRLPAEYRGNHYYVSDWRGHRLSAPPRGYRWVQNGNDYALAAITTGIIAQVMLNHHY